MAAYLLIGPSGSGKSMASKIVSERGASFSVVDLDKELKKRINGESLSNHLEYVDVFPKSAEITIRLFVFSAML
jgi:shikimate kinase